MPRVCRRFNVFEGVGDAVERVGRGDGSSIACEASRWAISPSTTGASASDKVAAPATCTPSSVAAGEDNGLDPVGLDAQFHSYTQIPGSEEVDERVDPARRRRNGHDITPHRRRGADNGLGGGARDV